MRPRLISTTHIRTLSRRTVALLGSLSIVLLLLACGGADMASSDGTPVAPDALSASVPRWVCPSATPLPPIQVEGGTQDNGMGTPVPKYRDTEPYEREYGVGQLPPPRPTPYGKGVGFQSQTAFFIGQIVNWPSVDVQVSVASARTTGASSDGSDTLG